MSCTRPSSQPWPHDIGLWRQLQFLTIQVELQVRQLVQVGTVLNRRVSHRESQRMLSQKLELTGHHPPPVEPHAAEKCRFSGGLSARNPQPPSSCNDAVRSSRICPMRCPSSISAEAGAAISEVPLSTMAAQPLRQTWGAPVVPRGGAGDAPSCPCPPRDRTW